MVLEVWNYVNGTTQNSIGQIQPTGGPCTLLWIGLRAALLYTYIKGGEGEGLNSLVYCYVQTIRYAKSTVE
jgi:hypothetical protein